MQKSKFQIFLKKETLIIFLMIFVFGCAPKKRFIEKSNDQTNLKYQLKFLGRHIHDTLFVSKSSGELILTDIYVNGAYQKNEEKNEKSEKFDSNTVKNSKRTAQGILDVINPELKRLKQIYNRYLKSQRFKGKIKFKYHISPSGESVFCFPIFNSTGNFDFMKEIWSNVENLKFNEINGTENDIVIIPLIFYE